MLSLPSIVTKFSYWILRFIVNKEIDIQKLNELISFFIYDVFQLQAITLLVIYTLYYDVFEEVFISGLQYIDQVTIANKKTSKNVYSTGLLKCKRVNLRNISLLSNWIAKLNRFSTHQINHLSQLLQSYLQLVMMNLFIYSCTHIPRLSSVVVSFIVSRSFNTKLGTSVTFLVF